MEYRSTVKGKAHLCVMMHYIDSDGGCRTAHRAWQTKVWQYQVYFSARRRRTCWCEINDSGWGAGESKVDAIAGLHMTPGQDTGTVGVSQGLLLLRLIRSLSRLLVKEGTRLARMKVSMPLPYPLRSLLHYRT